MAGISKFNSIRILQNKSSSLEWTGFWNSLWSRLRLYFHQHDFSWWMSDSSPYPPTYALALTKRSSRSTHEGSFICQMKQWAGILTREYCCWLRSHLFAIWDRPANRSAAALHEYSFMCLAHQHTTLDNRTCMLIYHTYLFTDFCQQSLV